MAMQTLGYSGYIKVDHERIQKDVEGLMDLNKDGVVDEEDGKQALDKLKIFREHSGFRCNSQRFHPSYSIQTRTTEID